MDVANMQQIVGKYIFEFMLRGTDSFPTEVVVTADGLDEAKKKATDVVNKELEGAGTKLTIKAIIETSLYAKRIPGDGKSKESADN